MKRRRTSPPAIVVHSLDHAVAALTAARETGISVTLTSATGAGAYAGAAWFAALIDQAAAAVPGATFQAVLDCGESPGAVLAALREGVRHIRFSGPPRARARLTAIADEARATVDHGAIAALDLARETDFLAACHAWLGEKTAGR